MSQLPYAYQQVHPRRYVFISYGIRTIEKVVDFIPLGIGNIMNLGFGDLLPDGSIADKVNSNNGDIIKVLATVIDILKNFTLKYPKAVIYFQGSTNERTHLYGRILRTYYQQFSTDYMIMAIMGNHTDNRTVLFDPGEQHDYLAFLIKRIS